jgi:uncharacterized protein
VSSAGPPGERAAREELERRVEATTRVVVRPLAGPLALGFLALGAATFVVSGLNLEWIDARETRNVALCLIAFTVPLQLLASVISFLARDGVAATGMGLLSGIWLAQGLVLHGSLPGSTSDALGLFLLAGAVAMLVPAAASVSAKLLPTLVLGTAALRFFVTGLYQLTASDAWKTAAGIVGLVLAGLALYAALAVELEDVRKRTVLPVGRRGKGVVAVEGTLYEQAAEVHHEPGVRQML